MTEKTVYDSAGTIVRVVDLLGDDPVRDAEIENVPVGGGSVDGAYDIDTVYFVAGVATARPAITVDAEYEIVADGEDSFWFEVPDETIIATPEGQFEATIADALVSISSWLVGTFTILVVPPLPYQQYEITVTVIPDDGGSPNLPPTTPDIEILLSQSALTGLAVLAKPKFNVVTWDISSDPEHDHYGLTRYESEADADADVDGVDIERITETFYKDADEFVNGVDCWYRVWDVDTNGNRSDKSDPVGEVARGVLSDDLENDAAIPSKVYNSDTTNLIRDPDMVDISLWSAIPDTGAAITAFAQEVNDVTSALGPSKFKLYATADGGTFVDISTAPDITVVPGAAYYCSARVGPHTAAVAAPELWVDYYEIDSGGDADYVSSEEVAILEAIPEGPIGPRHISGYVVVPADCVRMALRGRCATVGDTIEMASPEVRRKAVISAEVTTDSNYGTFGTSEQTIQSLTVSHGPNAKCVLLAATFRNTAGSAKTLSTVIMTGSTTLASRPTYKLTDDNYAEVIAKHDNPSGVSTTYDLKVTGSDTGNNVNNRTITAVVIP